MFDCSTSKLFSNLSKIPHDKFSEKMATSLDHIELSLSLGFPNIVVLSFSLPALLRFVNHTEDWLVRWTVCWWMTGKEVYQSPGLDKKKVIGLSPLKWTLPLFILHIQNDHHSSNYQNVAVVTSFPASWQFLIVDADGNYCWDTGISEL